MIETEHHEIYYAWESVDVKLVTATKAVPLRLFWVALAFPLLNLEAFVKWSFLAKPQLGAAPTPPSPASLGSLAPLALGGR